MVRERKEKRAKNIKLKQPDRSGPTDKTLLDLANERDLFKQAAAKERQNKRQNGEEDDDEDDEGEGLPPGAERILETMLYSVSLAMLHLTLDVLVQQQYALEMEWFKIIQRALQALMGMISLDLSILSSPPGPLANQPFLFTNSLHCPRIRSSPPRRSQHRRPRSAPALPELRPTSDIPCDGNRRLVLLDPHHQQV